MSDKKDDLILSCKDLAEESLYGEIYELSNYKAYSCCEHPSYKLVSSLHTLEEAVWETWNKEDKDLVPQLALKVEELSNMILKLIAVYKEGDQQ